MVSSLWFQIHNSHPYTEVVKLATEEAIAVGKVGRMVVQLKQELMHHVKHKQFEAAKTVCERVLMLAPRCAAIHPPGWCTSHDAGRRSFGWGESGGKFSTTTFPRPSATCW